MAASRHPEPAPADDPRWAELADLALVIAREIQFLGYRDPEAVPLTQTEGTVMRHLNEHDGAAPSVIAAATGLQRTNLATVLTALQRKGLIERHADPADGRAATIHTTEAGRTNYALVRREWADAVSAAARRDSGNLEPALSLLREVRAGLVESRPTTPGRPATLM
jgi:DNA-binding MarR family transcriptional regulator